MLVLVETAAGYAVFKLLKKKKLKQVDDLFKDFQSVEKANKIVELLDFHKFKDSAEALQSALAINDGKMDKRLKALVKKVLKHNIDRDLILLDAKLGSSIKEKFTDLNIVTSGPVHELIRCIKGQVENLIPGLTEKESTAMSLGLAHNLSRFKLKFSPDKVDTMVIQAIALLDELDKQLNNYVMRAREWYGWHFPELSKIVPDNTVYLGIIIHMGYRSNAKNTDLSAIMSEELEQRVKEAAEVSMGCEISPDDMLSVQKLCKQVKDFSEYREMLMKYIENRMIALAPNVSILVGEVIGARLLSHAGSLVNLSKMPASTIQLIGAEKALFRALKTKKKTPKYGLLYHSELVKLSSAQYKGKMSRMLAGKAALASRIDAMAEAEDNYQDFTINNKAKLKNKLKFWETGTFTRISKQSKYFKNPVQQQLDRRGPGQSFTGSGDAAGFRGGVKRPRSDDDSDDVPKTKKMKNGAAAAVAIKEEPADSAESPKKKKKKNKNREGDVATTSGGQEKEKKHSEEAPAKKESVLTAEIPEEGEKKKKKKKKKSKQGAE